MFTNCGVRAGAALGLLTALACSEAPVVPVQPTSRNVLAEVSFVDTT